jgi:PAS domain-containing protein
VIMLSRLTGWSKAEVESLPWSEFLHCLDEATQIAREEGESAMGAFK